MQKEATETAPTIEAQLDAVAGWVDFVVEFLVAYGFQLFGALVFLVIGLKVASLISRRIGRALEAKNVDVTLARFIGNVVRVVFIGILVIITLGNFGVSIAPLIALAGASAFGLTIALQGPVSNYAAGVVLILSRPFTVGSTITVKGNTSGVVEEITLAATRLIGEDGERITVPNKEIVGRVIINSEQRRVVQTKIAIADGQDVDAAVAALKGAVAGLPNFQGDADGGGANAPDPQIGVHDFAYGGLILGMRFWVPSKQYFELRYAANRAALDALRKAGIQLMPAAQAAVTAASLSADDDSEDDGLMTTAD